VDDFESHRGAETMPTKSCQLKPLHAMFHRLTILIQYIQALLHQQRGIEDDQAVADR